MRILAVGGGSGGHVTPVVAVLRELRKQDEAIDIRFWVDRKFAPQAKGILRSFDDTIRVDVQFENFPQQERSEFKREICFPDANLDAEALEKLFDIAEACPVHKLLTNKIEINTEIVK